MTLKYTPCFYHPDHVAVTVCFNCGKPICLKDKRNYTKNRGTDNSNHDYCVVCFVNLKKSEGNYNPMWIILPVLLSFMVLMIGMFVIMDLDRVIVGFFMVFFGLAFFMVVMIFGSVNPNKKPNVSADDLLQATELVQISSNSNNKEINYDNLTKDQILQTQIISNMQCPNCGTALTLEDKFCLNCGREIF